MEIKSFESQYVDIQTYIQIDIYNILTHIIKYSYIYIHAHTHVKYIYT
jgi:hypothetical protein